MKFQWVNGLGEEMVRDVLASFQHEDTVWVVVLDRACKPICIAAVEGEILY